MITISRCIKLHKDVTNILAGGKIYIERYHIGGTPRPHKYGPIVSSQINFNISVTDFAGWGLYRNAQSFYTKL
ncbi:hypothetical protein D3C76_1595380 [compost metagenome]